MAKDYQGKLTGAQIDAIPGRLNKLETSKLSTDLSNIDEAGEEKIKEIVNFPYYKEEIDKSVENVEKLKNDVETYIGAGKETVVVTVTSSVEGVDVSGLTLYVYLNNAETPIEVTTDDNGMATFRVDVGYQYRIVFPLIAGCAQITDVTHTAGVAWRNIEVDYSLRGYNAEKFTAKVIKWTGNEFEKFEGCNVHITIDGVTTDYQCDANGEVIIYVPLGKEYTVTFDKIDDLYTYGEIYRYSFIANSPKRELMINYRDVNVGIFIVANDLAQYTKEQWIASGRPSSDAGLIRLATYELCKSGNTFAINIDEITERSYIYETGAWSSQNRIFDAIPNIRTYFGLEHTFNIINEGVINNISTPAATLCINKNYRNSIPGFLGAVFQFESLKENEKELNDIIKLVRPDSDNNITTLFQAELWTSDQSSAEAAWSIKNRIPTSTYKGKTNTHSVIAFYAI